MEDCPLQDKRPQSNSIFKPCLSSHKLLWDPLDSHLMKFPPHTPTTLNSQINKLMSKPPVQFLNKPNQSSLSKAFHQTVKIKLRSKKKNHSPKIHLLRCRCPRYRCYRLILLAGRACSYLRQGLHCFVHSLCSSTLYCCTRSPRSRGCPSVVRPLRRLTGCHL